MCARYTLTLELARLAIERPNSTKWDLFKKHRKKE